MQLGLGVAQPLPPTPRRYVTGDFRFRNGYCRSNPRKMVKVWAEKEMRNLMRLNQAGGCQAWAGGGWTCTHAASTHLLPGWPQQVPGVAIRSCLDLSPLVPSGSCCH
jgi:hypothetical protein